jgi:hypothetical protein
MPAKRKDLQPGNYVGVPACWNLERFGSMVMDVFGDVPYQVGTSTSSKIWRDVDVRLILADEDWERWDLGDPKNPNVKWQTLCYAFTELGRSITGLPIDFQIQQMTRANGLYKGRRNALIDKSRFTPRNEEV